jgi:C-8 sterol isomerase
MPPPKQPSTRQSSTRFLTILSVSIALISALLYFLDSHLEWFYIFSPSELHDLSLRAISAHGNDTAGVVAFITRELSEKFPGGYVNLEQEWFFNNAGGAMGAMYVVHASKFPLESDLELHHMAMLTIHRHHGVPHHLWYTTNIDT